MAPEQPICTAITLLNCSLAEVGLASSFEAGARLPISLSRIHFQPCGRPRVDRNTSVLLHQQVMLSQGGLAIYALHCTESRRTAPYRKTNLAEPYKTGGR
jgi:hypothetical protein